MRVPLALVTAALVLSPAAAAPAAEPLVKQVEQSIARARDYLIQKQSPQGDWEQLASTSAATKPGGCTCLALLALLNAGVPAENKAIQNGLTYLRTKVPPRHTYVVGLQTMVYCLAGDEKQRIEANVKWLLDARRMEGKKLLGWSYDLDKAYTADASNTQYALLGLHEAQLAGIKIDKEVWDSIRDYYINTQTTAGAYGYWWDWSNNTIHGRSPRPGALFTMTTAGLCGLLIAGSDLNAGRETPIAGGAWKNCGEYVENEKVASALKWLGAHFPAGANLALDNPYVFYGLYGIERAGRLTGMRFLGEHDWYRAGCEFLVATQDREGTWTGRGEMGVPVISTSFALLFLSKGRTPILISKLTHDGVGMRGGIPIRRKATADPNDWNNDRNDARHLVDFAGRELFKRKPMGWQVFNSSETGNRRADDLAAELLQSPIAYFNGHLAPEFTANEEEMLKTFVSNGGIIFAEACCGSKEFDTGFEALMKKLFPDQTLMDLGPNHPVWTAAGKFAIPGSKRGGGGPFPLKGIEMGCMTVVIYSPNDLSCRWESNQFEDHGDNELAFHVGANVIAYATGLEPPQPRLTQVDVPHDDPRDRKVPRGFLKVGQLKHDGDSHVAPQAIPHLMRELRDKTGLDVALQVDEVWPTKRTVAQYKFLYMHGRKQFNLPKDQLGDLRFNLEHHGLLFADACCGATEFDKSFRELIVALWGDKYKLERIPMTDDLFDKELNGEPLTTVRCRRDEGGKRDMEYQNYEPYLEGVKIKGRWVVIYSRWDIGCALEKTRSPDCLGHDYDSAVKIGRAVVLYHLR
jgi:hypothetical protein